MTWQIAGDIAAAVLVVGGSVFMLIRTLKERRARKRGLPANPTRCIEAEKRISALEVCHAKMETKVDLLGDKVDDIHTDVKELLRLHIKP